VIRRDKAEWQLTGGALERLLDRLDPDRDRAGERYESLRQTLVKFFDWRGASSPDDCADETLDRLIRKLDEGALIEEVGRYAHGIARLVLLEQMRDPLPRAALLEDVPAAPALVVAPPLPVDDDEDSGTRDCFDACLDSLPADSRELILRYYVDERRAKIDGRVDLAKTLGITSAALRSRAQRIRDRLEKCVGRCRKSGAVQTTDDEH
jgi:DNA-directed RNA polymerase specialized sigma24 family protein